MSLSIWLIVSLISAPVLSSLSLLFLFSSVLARLSTLCEAHRQGSLKAEEMRVFFALKENVCKNNLQRLEKNILRVAGFVWPDVSLHWTRLSVWGSQECVYTEFEKKKNIQRTVVAIKTAKNWDMLSKMYTLRF